MTGLLVYIDDRVYTAERRTVTFRLYIKRFDCILSRKNVAHLVVIKERDLETHV